MAHISGHDRSQTLLFPEAVDDDVGPDNPVRFIDAVRHITWRWIPFAERRGLEEMTLGPAA